MGALPPKEAFSRAKTAATRALELDDTLAEAHVSLGFAATFYDWNWSTAEREFKRAIELNPSYATAHLYYSWYLGSQMRLDESLAEVNRAHELDPLSNWISVNMAAPLFWLGQYDQAIEHVRSTLEFDPDFPLAHWMLGITYAQKGMYEDAIAEIRETLSQGREYAGWLGYNPAPTPRQSP